VKAANKKTVLEKSYLSRVVSKDYKQSFLEKVVRNELAQIYVNYVAGRKMDGCCKFQTQ